MQRHSNHHEPHVLTLTPREITEGLLGRVFRASPRYWVAVGVLGFLVLLGIIGFVIRLQDGFDQRAKWGYLAAAFAYLLTTAGSAPMVSIATRMVKAHWRRPLSRAAELMAVVGVFNFLLLLPLLAALPALAGRKTIWTPIFWLGRERPIPLGAPVWWDALAVLFLVLCGLGLLWAGALPDLAAAAGRGTGVRRNLWARLAAPWRGTLRQWRILAAGVGVLGGLYFMFLIFTHFLVSVDLGMSLVPGWKDAIFPAFHALSGLQSAVAVTLVTLFFLRYVGGYREYITLEQFWGLAKILLALSLLWFYFWWATFITFWYGRSPAEQNLLKYLMFESYRVPFLLAFFLNFLVPFLMMIWNPIRVSILGPTIAGASVLIGTFFDRIRLYVAAFSIEGVTAHRLEFVPPAHLPDGADILMVIGAIAGAILVYLLALRLLPPISIWEVKEGLQYQAVRTLGRLRLRSLGKPD
ncbi:MAG: hypothetical protein HY686_07580 [Chloroflexi bacterium]|nr:hypothetical protein [Chloroflexota bacterium]